MENLRIYYGVIPPSKQLCQSGYHSPVFPSVPSFGSADSAPLPQRSTSGTFGLYAGLFATLEKV